MADCGIRGRHAEKVPETRAKAPDAIDVQRHVKSRKARPGPSRTRETGLAQEHGIERLVPRHVEGAQYYDPMQHVEEDEPDTGIWLRRSAVPLMFLAGTLFGWLSMAAACYLGH